MKVLSEAVVATFFDDPLYVWLFGDPSQRADALRANFGLIFELAHERGVIDVVNGSGVAVWTRPGVDLLEDPAPFVELLQQWAPDRIDAALEGMTACNRLEPPDAMMLHLIGVHPAH